MKRILALGISAVLMMPVFSMATVLAEDASTNVTTTPTTTTAKTETETSADDTASIQARVEKRKAELKVKLAAAEKLKIQTKCKAAQGLVSSVKGRVQGIETSRTEVYTNIVNRLTDLSEKLKNKGADTTALDSDITALQAKITTFNTDLATYKQSVSDLAAMDCKTDPDGFKASLLAARTSLDAVNKDSQAVKAYVNDTIKPLLKTIRAALETPKTGGSQ